MGNPNQTLRGRGSLGIGTPLPTDGRRPVFGKDTSVRSQSDANGRHELAKAIQAATAFVGNQGGGR